MTPLASTHQRQEHRPPTGEAPFDAGEVFYSRTDRRGVIVAGNYIFRRVSHYDWENLIGAPHKIIRHPDMPKAVFWLLWKKLAQGETFGGYIKNRASDGLYYWVYAVVAPMGEGYISTRIKPGSALFPQIERLYNDLRQGEESGLSPEESATDLIARLHRLGFDSYEEFMTHAFGEELLNETTALRLAPEKSVARARTMLALSRALSEETAHLAQEFDVLSSVPHNMKVVARRIEPTGGPISALSRNYGDMSNALSQWFLAHVLGEDSNFSRISASVKQSMWMTCFAGLLQRCEAQLRAERRALGPVDISHERAGLNMLAKDYFYTARDGMSAVITEARRIHSACDEIRRKMLALSTVRLACKIEDARDPARSGNLQGIIDQLGKSQQHIDARVTRIRTTSAKIISIAEEGIAADAIHCDKALLYGKRMAAALHPSNPEGVEKAL
ncbi:PAS domain-containing protein [Rhodalgimonas zhirmunskyi]|uniref:PAS domain-containing protein n=1 Tax=Rhodalgimonas zhirmunskyi TaxID=2964767 RepID=A0AAJ1X5K3_9RHOB|nr:PAS domain-containing protein [Rhodoalgimonas zhirmunskyi]MDQ2094611.1 PAS domain-containing protein [Rhodoalgimonas zhirmunskyi]